MDDEVFITRSLNFTPKTTEQHLTVRSGKSEAEVTNNRRVHWRYCTIGDWHSTGSTPPDCNWTTKFRSQWTSHVEPSATRNTVTGPVGERLQAGTEDAPVLDCPAPLRRFHDSGTGYKYPDLLIY